jgi:hypothetical protein
MAACNNDQAQERNIIIYEEDRDIEYSEPDEISPYTDNTDAPKFPYEGRLAIMTDFYSPCYFSVQTVMVKYGEERVRHVNLGGYRDLNEREGTNKIEHTVASDPELKAMVINTNVKGLSTAFERVRKNREDIFIAFCEPPYGDAVALSPLANLVLMTNELNTGSAMVKQANKMGAENFVHYSHPVHMDSDRNPVYYRRREQIKQQCEELGIKFINVIVPDLAVNSKEEVEAFIQDDVPKMAEEHGKNTAFFATNCFMQAPLIKAVIETGTIYPQPCCFSSANAISTALGLKTDMDYIPILSNYYGLADANNAVIEFFIEKDMTGKLLTWSAETKAALAEKGMSGRLSTWPVYDTFMYTYVDAEYAVKWINGEVPKEGVDVEELKQLMEEYAGVEVFLAPYTDEYPYTDNGTGETYGNVLMMRMGYVTFE